MKFKIFKVSVNDMSLHFQESINTYLEDMDKQDHELVDKTIHTIPAADNDLIGGTLVITLWHNKRPAKYMKIPGSEID